MGNPWDDKYENNIDMFWKNAKSASKQLCQSILAFSWVFGVIASDICHPFWQIYKSLLSIILLLMINDWGFTDDQIVSTFTELKVVSTKKQVQKHLKSGPTARSKRFKITCSGNQCRRGMYNMHEFIISGSHYIKGDVPALLWATMWRFWVEFTFCLYVLFKAKFDLNDPNHVKLLDDAIKIGENLYFIFTIYCDFFLFPYLVNFLMFLLRKQKIFVYWTGACVYCLILVRVY